MEGSPKQIAWATRIRIKHLPALKRVADMFQHADPSIQARVRELAAEALKEDDASFWITHRNDSVETILKSVEARMPDYDHHLEQKAIEEAEAIMGIRQPSSESSA